jgi:hypothetical protein
MKGRHRRSGLWIRGHRGHPEVRAALLRYARWLRLQFEFPVRVPVYLLPGAVVRTMDGNSASASIFLPWDRKVERTFASQRAPSPVSVGETVVTTRWRPIWVPCPTKSYTTGSGWRPARPGSVAWQRAHLV